MTFEEVRARFPVLDRFAYLNAGTFGPLSHATVEAMAERQRCDCDDGRAGKAYFEGMLALRERVREALAALVGVAADSVALTTSTTDGCNIVVRGLRLDPDDEVVTTDEEHFGLVGALAVSGARIRVVPATRILDAVGPRTRLLALSHVSWVTGNVLPVAELKRETGLPVLVDGAQSAGAIPVEAGGFDFFTISAQKWLCGPDGTGGLVVADPEALAITAPSYFAQQSYDLATATFEPRPGAARFDSGWIATASLAGLEAALAELPAWRYDRARSTAERCRKLLAERYEVVTRPGQATLVSYRPDGDPAELAARAFEQGVVIRDLPGTGLARVSCGYWTSDDDLQRLLAVHR